MRTSSAPHGSRLTQLSHGAGYPRKIGAADLEEIRSVLRRCDGDPNLIVGLDPADDAVVYRIADDLALVYSVDFLTPVVDDPYDFGRIAAANALSDIYAMGATPILGLNVVAFPIQSLGTDVLAQILRGGSDMATEAGVFVAGGHSIDDPEPKYGMAVTGTARPTEIVTLAGAQIGDRLFLTKPVGAGLITTAAKGGLASEAAIAAATKVMTGLNVWSARAAQTAGARAMTDVTGFGLLGHLHELAAASEVAAKVDANAVPMLEESLGLVVDPRCVSEGSRANALHAAGFTDWASSVSDVHRTLLTDVMTSGGLLVAVPPDGASAMVGTEIGVFTDGTPGEIQVI